jgi:hypothetical protein
MKLFILISLVIWQGNLAQAEIPKSKLEKKEFTQLDWDLIQVAEDIKAGVSMHRNSPGFDKWKIYPALSSISGTEKAINMRFDISDRNFAYFGDSEKREQFEKIITFSLDLIKRRIAAVVRGDLAIDFYYSASLAGQLRNGDLKIMGELYRAQSPAD